MDNLVVIEASEWEQTCRDHKAWPEWAAANPEFAPGSFLDRDTGDVFMRRTEADAGAAGEAWAVTLAVHERRHKAGLPSHPPTLEGCMEEARSYGFDERSFTRFLRIHIGDTATYAREAAWFADALKRAGYATVKPATGEDPLGLLDVVRHHLPNALASLLTASGFWLLGPFTGLPHAGMSALAGAAAWLASHILRAKKVTQ